MSIEIKVNGEVIRYVEIINRGAPEVPFADDDRRYEYLGSDAAKVGSMGGEVVHRRSKGAYALAAQVLVRLRDEEARRG